MKINKSKLAVTMLMSSVSLVSFVSNADAQFSDANSFVLPLEFKAPAQTTLTTISLESKLPTAGVVSDDGFLLFTAKGQQKSSNTENQRMGMRFTPGLPTQVDITNTKTDEDGKATLVSASNPNNRISIKMVNLPAGAWQKSDKASGAGNGQSFYTTAATTKEMSIGFALDGEQSLVADHYTASIDTALYY